MLMSMLMVMVKLVLFVDVDVACMLTWYAAFACYGLERFQPLFSFLANIKFAASVYCLHVRGCPYIMEYEIGAGGVGSICYNRGSKYITILQI